MDSENQTEENLENEMKARLKMTLHFENWPTVWGMVLGGVQIPPVIHRFFLLDSNAVTRLRSVGKMLSPEREWWETILTSKDTVLNVIPYAIEGNRGDRPPTREEFQKRFEEVIAQLRGQFPATTYVDFDDPGFEAVYDIVKIISDFNKAENSFLIEVAPLIKNQVGRSRMRGIEDAILKRAAANSLTHSSFSVYAALSCVYSSSNNYRPAAGVLKPAIIERDRNAYNALTDLSLLRTFIGGLALSASSDFAPPSLLSADKKLLMFWMGLQVRNVRINDERVPEANFTYSDTMFPEIDEDERVALAARVKELG